MFCLLVLICLGGFGYLPGFAGGFGFGVGGWVCVGFVVVVSGFGCCR